jgi:hypothetical protein
MTDFSKYRRILLAAAVPLMLVSCAQGDQTAEAETEQAQADAASSDAGSERDGTADAADTAAQTDAADDPVKMPVMSQTGWRVQGEDGAVYTTFFDPDGTYRDFKNGEPLQTGTWEERVDGKLCFTPSAEGRIGECWELGPVTSAGIMKPVNDAGKAIELRTVTYIAPEEEG